MTKTVCAICAMVVLVATGVIAEAQESRRGWSHASVTLAGAVPVTSPRRQSDYVILRQFEYFIAQDVALGFGLGVAGPIDGMPVSALLLQSAYNAADRAFVPYVGAHAGLIANFSGPDLTGTLGPLVGFRWKVGGRWSLVGETRCYATTDHWPDSFLAFAIGINLASAPL